MENEFINSLCDKEFDKKFDDISLLKRYPWVGVNYASSKCRVLILGDSHYAQDKNGEFSQEEYDASQNKNYTRGIISCVISNIYENESTWKMYNGLLNTFIDTDISPKNANEFWSKVAFYNFIQETMRSSSDKPSGGNKKEGWKCLVEVAKVLNPDQIIMFGIRNWWGLEYQQLGELNWSDEKINSSKPAIGQLNMSDKKIPLAIIRHSARGYKSSTWQKYLQENAKQAMKYLMNN